MRIDFTKMHGLGNDFIVFDAPPGGLPSAATLRRLADRRTGIGFDQALVIEPPRRAGTSFYYRNFNADGSEVEQCGNGARCIAALWHRRGRVPAGEMLVMDSLAGEVHARVLPPERAEQPEQPARTVPGDAQPGMVERQIASARPRGTGALRVAVDLGVPSFDPRTLPFDAAGDASFHDLDAAGERVRIGAVSLGNPHAVLEVSSVETAPVERLGPAIEHHRRFPRRVNVGFMEIVDRGNIRLRVHERGAGETQACGTGACAAVAVGRRRDLLDAEVRVHVRGGELRVNWEGPGSPIWLTGPADVAFEGRIELDDRG